MPFTAKQQRFIEEYLLDLNASRAAVRAGYSARSAGSVSWRLLRHPAIAEAVAAAKQERAERTRLDQDRVIRELSRIAFGDLRDLAEWDGESLTLKSSDSLSEAAAAAVCEVSQTQSGIKLKRCDKLKALELLMRHAGMFREEPGLPSGGVTPVFKVVLGGSGSLSA